MATVEVKVPDIGDFTGVPVIEVLVKVGDTVKPEDALVTLESDKATMDVPAPSAGTVKSIAVKVGDKVSEGALVLVLESADAKPVGPASAGRPSPAPAAAPAPAPQPRPAEAGPTSKGAGAYQGKADLECEMLVLGAGPGGYSAAFRAADLGMKTVIVERYATLGGVCLNVGCIPSKALLHVAAVMDEAKSMADHGVTFGAPQVDAVKLKAWKNKVVGKLTGGLAGMAKTRKVEVVRGVGQFLDPHHLEVELTQGAGQEKSGAKKVVKFAKAIIAVGSQVVRLPFIPDDPRVLDSTSALELESIPKRMLVIGGGIIGLEMGTVYSTLGTRLDVVEMMDGLMPGADRDLVRVWEKMNKPRFDRIMLKTKTVALEARKDALYATFEGEGAPQGPQPYDKVLMSVGARRTARRSPPTRRRRGHRPRLHRGRLADAHERRAHLRDRRRRRPADARAQGRARGPRRGRGRRGAEEPLRRARDPVGRVHRSRDRVGRPDRGRREGEGHRGHQGRAAVGRVGTRDRERPRRGPHEAPVRRDDAPHRRRRHRRHARGRPDRRDRARDRDGRGRRRHRAHRASAPDARRVDRPRRRGRRRRLHGRTTRPQALAAPQEFSLSRRPATR
jgi:NADPH-dependent 2,4-dienoyl-CoA reductase/sulfur reductase-like enzyme